MAYHILHQPWPPETKTALSMSEDTWAHACQDSKRIDHAYMKAGAAILLGVPLATAATVTATQSPETALSTMALLNLGVAAYLFRTIKETRDKIGHFRENYNISENCFTERDQRLTTRLKDEVFSDKPTLTEYFRNARQYPFTSTTGIAGTALALATQSPALGALSLSIFMVTLAAEESCMLNKIGIKARQSYRMIKTCNKLGIF